MRKHPLTAAQRLAVAEVSGIGQRCASGRHNGVEQAAALQELWSVTRDPIIYGIALGAALAQLELDGWAHAQRLADLYRAAGADEQIAAYELQWHRDRPGRPATSPRQATP